MFTDSDIRAALREVVDPELGVNIVDLGLLCGIDIEGPRVRLAITPTSPACPMLNFLKDLITSELTERVPGIQEVAIEVVWDPPWDPDRITEAGRAQLNGDR